MSATATLKIRRGGAGETPRFETYEVPFEPGQSVLDGLRWLRIHQDPTLAVRFSCLSLIHISSDRKSTRLNSSHPSRSRMPSSA